MVLHLRSCMNRLCLRHIASLWQFDGIKASDFEDVRAALLPLSPSASERMKNVFVCLPCYHLGKITITLLCLQELIIKI